MEGQNAIILKILSDAELRAAEITSLAKEKAGDVLLSATNAEKERVDKLALDAQKRAEDIIKNRITLAELDIHKDKLRARRDLLDSAYEKAADKIFSMPAAKYQELIMKMLRKYASDGETVICGKGDESRIDGAFIKRANAELKITLKLAESSGDFSGGVILVGAGYDKNLTFKSLFKTLRSETEPQTAAILFDESHGK